MNIPLHPTLASIERDLFDHASTSPASVGDDVDPHIPADLQAPEMPPHLLELVRRKVAAAHAHPAAPLAVGQIRSLIRAPDGQGGDRALGKTCAVLLERWLSGRCWAGSMVAQEVDYAANRDLVLQDDHGVFAPEAAIVQAWNPVEVELRGDETLLGTVSAEALQAVLKLADPGFAEDDFVPPRPGRIGAWDLDTETTVVTGTPLGGDDDPRQAYQHLYHSLAAVFTRAALASRMAPQPKSEPRADGWWGWLRHTFVRPAWTFGALGFVFVQTAWLLSSHSPGVTGDGTVYRGVAPQQQAAPCRTMLRVVFKLDTPYAELVIALRRAGVTLVNGPSQTGEIWVLPPADQDPREVAAMLQQHHQVERVDLIPPDRHLCAQ
jgi:hypothetical protein